MKTIKILSIVLSFFVLYGLSSCNSSTKKESEDQSINDETLAEIDSNNVTIIKFKNTLFSIPSPYQVSILIKKANIEYNPELVNSLENIANYTSNFKKAINMGVYGTDLAYLNMNKQIPKAVKYFANLKIMSEELQLSGAFNPTVIKQIENNMGNEDSLLYILSKTYRESDKYLKENNREDLGVLILAGGWIESLYFLAKVADETHNQEIINRLGDQKHPLDNLIKIMSQYYNQSPQYMKIIEDLIDLAYVYDGIDVEYEYKEPITDTTQKITTINSTSKLILNAEHINLIAEKIAKIREKIID